MILYKKGYKYQLRAEYVTAVSIKPTHDIETEFVQLTSDGKLTIAKNYAWDGCSGPTHDDMTNMRGGLVHDALYQLMREGQLSVSFRPEVDRLLKDICLEDGMCEIRAWVYHHAVAAFGKKFAAKQSETVLSAPRS